MANLNFDSTTIEPAQSFAVVPAGLYIAQIVESDIKPLKSGNGDGLSLQFEILDGEHKGRRIFANLNVRHTNQDAQRISQQQLSAICHAVGVLKLQDSTQLHGKPMRIKVKIRKQDGYDDQNQITGFEPLQPGARPTTPAPSYQQASQSSAVPRKPWERAAEPAPF